MHHADSADSAIPSADPSLQEDAHPRLAMADFPNSRPPTDAPTNGPTDARSDSTGHDEVLSLAETRLFARAADGDREAIAEVWHANRRWIAAVLAAHAPRA